MPASDQSDITQLLMAWKAGDCDAVDKLFPLVYDELHRIAQYRLQRSRGGDALSASALVHEMYLRLADQAHLNASDRVHFYRIASRIMRHILVDHARHKNAQKRGGGAPRLALDACPTGDDDATELLLSLDQALAQLEELDERLHQVVECRFFGGLTCEETARTLGVAPRTVQRDWRKAKALLSRVLTEASSSSNTSPRI